MAKLAKLLKAVAGSAGGAGLDVDEVFSTYLYDGTGSAQTITNGIDLSGEGGLVWIKRRDGSNSHNLEDTARGAGKSINSDTTNAEDDQSGSFGISAFNSNGFSLVGAGGRTNTNNPENYPNYVSWSFRKAPKFFDVLTYTGTGVNGRTVSHNLGAAPGMIIVKQTSASGEPWYVYHRSTGATKRIFLSSANAAATSDDGFYDTEPTSTEFTVAYNGTNKSGATYVAYVFAHNNSDGEFGPTGDQDIIKCGDFTSSGNAADITLGFEPQFLLIKQTDSGSHWFVVDAMRGLRANGVEGTYLSAQSSNAESSDYDIFDPHPTGFNVTGINNGHWIYMAIRRGPLAAPTDATKVFNVQEVSGSTNSTVTTGFPVDLIIDKVTNDNDTQSNIVIDRLRGIAKENEFRKNLLTYSTGPESSSANIVNGPSMTGYVRGSYWSGYTNVMFNWKRAPEYFDVVAWSQASDTAVTTINHNLTNSPEMIWTKSRGGTRSWVVYHKDITSMLKLNETARANNTDPHQNVGSTSFQINGSVSGEIGGPENYISYLFATVAGVSKISSVVHSGTTNVDAGFSSGSRFVLLKRTDATGDWYVWNSASGIVAGNDPYILFNERNAEVTNTDLIDPLSSGFTLTSNLASGTYIFYAIA